MKEIDFSECEFIDSNLTFTNYNDFCRDCFIIKYNFKKLSRNGRRFYMWYVYANTHIDLFRKNIIWDYLNDYCNETRLFNSIKFYKDKLK